MSVTSALSQRSVCVRAALFGAAATLANAFLNALRAAIGSAVDRASKA